MGGGGDHLPRVVPLVGGTTPGCIMKSRWDFEYKHIRLDYSIPYQKMWVMTRTPVWKRNLVRGLSAAGGFYFTTVYFQGVAHPWVGRMGNRISGESGAQMEFGNQRKKRIRFGQCRVTLFKMQRVKMVERNF